jgi:hypothetical protein
MQIEGLLTEYRNQYLPYLLQLIQAHLWFNFKKPDKEGNYKKALDLRLDDYKVAQVKMELADILLLKKNSIRH